MPVREEKKTRQNYKRPEPGPDPIRTDKALSNSFRESATLDLDQRSGRAGEQVPTSLQLRADRENDMPSDPKPTQKRIDQFISGPGGRADDWRDLVEAAKTWARG